MTAATRLRPSQVLTVVIAIWAGGGDRPTHAEPPASNHQRTRPKSREIPMNRNFDLALRTSGQPYSNLELDLRQHAQVDASAAEALRKAALSHLDPIARLLARVILDWAEPKGADFKAALDYLEYAPIRLKRTAAGFPSPMGVESYLTRHFADRVAELLALRLVKESGWPRWKVGAIIFYLQAHKLVSTTSALVRFAIETDEADWRKFAVDAIREIQDPDLGAKLAFEIARARKLRRSVPADVGQLVD
jgi:hypothetical protein